MLVRRHLPGLLARLEEAGHALPEFVKAELDGFTGCGDFELPAVGYRQWVLSFEGRMAVRLGYDPTPPSPITRDRSPPSKP